MVRNSIPYHTVKHNTSIYCSKEKSPHGVKGLGADEFKTAYDKKVVTETESSKCGKIIHFMLKLEPRMPLSATNMH